MAHAVSYNTDADQGLITIEHDEYEGPIVTQVVQFQHGPVAESGENGIQNEDVLLLLAMRLRALNKGFPCRENSIAITHIETALLWLHERTRVRVEQGVEGHNVPHEEPLGN